MKVIESVSEMQDWARAQVRSAKMIGLVPTMGFLHEGHLSLIRKAREKTDQVAVSIFVNPTQFGAGEDFDRYPRDLEGDLNLCRQEGVAVVFYPAVKEMYPREYKTFVITEELSNLLCGRSRPGHFKGVTTICCKLFNIIKPHFAVFGQKDAQQTIIIKRMVADLNLEVEIIVSPIVREADGLAMSSRNKYLSSQERSEATVLYRALKLARTELENKNFNLEAISSDIQSLIQNNTTGLIDYIEIVDAQTLTAANPQQADTLIALAVFFGKTRLIDNLMVPKIN